MKFRVGQRVKTIVDSPAAWEGAFSAPAGTQGTIVETLTHFQEAYGVLLDGDPDQLPAHYTVEELTSA